MKLIPRLIYLIYQPTISLYYVVFWLYSLVNALYVLILRKTIVTTMENNYGVIVRVKKKREQETFFSMHAREKLGLHLSQLFPNTNTKTKSKNNHPTPLVSLVWIHAVSGGEVKLVEKIIRLFYSEKNYSGKILITYCSHTGYEFAQKLFSTNPNILTSYLPIDSVWIMSTMVHRIRTNYSLEKMVVVEQDLWPNLLANLKAHHVERVVVNYFLKPSDFKRFRFFPPAFHFIHQVDTLVAQSEAELSKLAFFEKGSSPTMKILKGGNLKYGPFVLPDKKKPVAPSPLTICLGSSHNGEDELLLNALLPHFENGTCKRCVLIPRHPERAQSLYEKIIKQFASVGPSQKATVLKENIIRLDTLTQIQPKISSAAVLIKHLSRNISNHKRSFPEIIIVDTLGLSETAYRLSDIVLIGDSFFPSNGGHNFFEAMACGVPVVYGPYMVSYNDITAYLEEAGAVIRVDKAENKEKVSDPLTGILTKLISDTIYRKKIGVRALKILRTIGFDKEAYQKIFSVSRK